MNKLIVSGLILCASLTNTFASPVLSEQFDHTARELVSDGHNQYNVYRVIPDGNCGFSALGTTREDTLKFVQDNLSNPSIQFFLSFEAKDFYEQKLNNLALDNDLYAYYQTLLSDLSNQTIDRSKVLSTYLIEAYQIESSSKYIPLEKYLVCHQAYGAEERPPTGLIDCIALMINCNINVWEKENTRIYLSRSIVHPESRRTIDIMRVGVHFERLVILGHYGNPTQDQVNLAEAEKSEAEWNIYNQNYEAQLQRDFAFASELEDNTSFRYSSTHQIENDQEMALRLSQLDINSSTTATTNTSQLELDEAVALHLTSSCTEISTNALITASEMPYSNNLPDDFDPELYLALNAHRFEIPFGMSAEERAAFSKENYLSVGIAMGWSYK